MSFEEMGDRVRRKVRTDGVVVDIRGPADESSIELDGGKVLSLSPPTVRLRGGGDVVADGYVATGVQPAVGDWVVVVRKGGFVLLVGKVVLL